MTGGVLVRGAGTNPVQSVIGCFFCSTSPALRNIAECMKATEVAARAEKEAAVRPASGEVRACFLTKDRMRDGQVLMGHGIRST